MMFGMIPFDRRDDNLFDVFDNFEKKFFGNTNASLPAFRTDIRDQGDKFLLEAELPGFQKEDISLELKEGILTIKAEHKENQDQKDNKGNYIRRERRYGSCLLYTSPPAWRVRMERTTKSTSPPSSTFSSSQSTTQPPP